MEPKRITLPEQIKLDINESQARQFYRMAKEFYKDSENVKRFEEWKKTKR